METIYNFKRQKCPKGKMENGAFYQSFTDVSKSEVDDEKNIENDKTGFSNGLHDPVKEKGEDGKGMDFEDILINYVGQCGRFQKLVVFFAMFFHMFGAFNNMGTVFVAATPEHWCASPELDHLNLTEDQIRNLTIPLDDDGNYEQCSMYEVDYTGWTLEEVMDCIITGCNRNETVNSYNCRSGMQYSKKQYQSTIVTEFDLVCERRTLESVQVSLYMVGLLFGVFFSGILSDRFGRLPVTVITFVGMTVTMIGTGLVHNFIAYCFMRFLCGVFTIANFTTVFILAIEMVGPKYRMHAVMIYEYFWAIGLMLFAVFAYFIRSWEALQLASSIPCALLAFTFILIPESPRWLYVKQRPAAGDNILKRMAKINKTSVPDPIIVNVATKKKGNFWEIFSTPNIRNRSFVQFYLWFVVSVGYFMLGLGSNDLAGNNYLNYFIGGVVDFFAFTAAQIMLSFIGRRVSLAIFYFIGGVALLATIPVPNDLQIVGTVLSMIGKFGMQAGFATLYVFTPELYPTSLRNVGISTASLFARIGGILSPFIADVGYYIWWFPNALVGVFAVVAGFVTFLLPETKDQMLPDTIEEAEVFGTEKARRHSLSLDVSCDTKAVEDKESAYTARL